MLIKKGIEKAGLYFSYLKNAAGFILYGRHVPYLLLDTPSHANLGDQAIAFAERQYLIKHIGFGGFFEVTAGQFDKFKKLYSKYYKEDGVILVHGGGFLGSLWIEEELRFREILECFHNNRIIVLPQTITFDMKTDNGRRFFEESYSCYRIHKRLTVCTRESVSYNFVKESMPDINCILVPDIVTIMEMEIGDSLERRGALLCLRRDSEKKIEKEDINTIKSALMKYFKKEDIKITDTVLNNPNSMILPSMRKRLLVRKLRQFASYEVIITDRLHGMVFAALTGTPCIALANCNHKVEGVFEWLKGNKYLYFTLDVNKVKNILGEIDFKRKYKYNYDLILPFFDELERHICGK